MSRSYRKTPVFGNCSSSTSEKQCKRKANRCLRSKIRCKLRTRYDDDALVFDHIREVSNVWSMAKDGKRYWRYATPKDMRK